MATRPSTEIEAYLQALPDDRRRELTAVRKLVKANLPKGFQEVFQYGMLSYVVPLARFPDTYNGQPLAVVSLASQSRHLSLYLMGLYGSPQVRRAFEAGWRKSGKKLDMGKSCLRFASTDALALDVVAEALRGVSVDDLIAQHQAVHGARQKRVRKVNARAAVSNRKRA